MKKIYWFIQQAEEFGGTEMVSLQILSSLASDYDITLVLTSKKPNSYIYPVPENVKQVYLGYKMDEIRMDYYMKKYKDQKRIFKMISLALRATFNLLIRRFFTRRKVKKMTTKDDILVATSLDNYLVMPRKRKVFYHYHFNAKFFFSLPESFFRWFMRKPDKWIFLCKSTLSDILRKKKKYKEYATYALNPVRFTPYLDENYYNNEFIFVGRFMNQKNPLLLLKSMKELKDMGDKFVLHMYGDGPFKSEMEEYISSNDLGEYILLHDSTKDILREYKNKDMMLVSSIYEGFSLVMLEANSQSLPIISTNWGDAVYEMVENGKNGYVVDSFEPLDFAKQVHEVIKNKEHILDMKRCSFEMSKKYTLDNTAKYWKENILK